MKPTISPSTLSNGLDVNIPDLVAQLLELDAAKSLRQDVRLLGLCVARMPCSCFATGAKTSCMSSPVRCT